MGHCKRSAKEKVHSNTGIHQETRKKSNKYPNSTSLQTKMEKLYTVNKEKDQELTVAQIMNSLLPNSDLN